MKLLLLISLLAVSSALAGSLSDIPADHRKVLSLPESTWKPSAEQVSEALAIAQKFLENPVDEDERSKGEIRKILREATDYRVQAWGETTKGRKLLHLNFFPAPPPSGEDSFSSWTKQRVRVHDGGYGFWEVAIDLESGRVVLFHSNGYADLKGRTMRELVAVSIDH